ncbi:hypothetical protein ACNHKD_04155 [Methylocystis sp. JAN1]|uniref:hypothetical protein n=1 Tax=Methylocystis sp. JAN1 TaxID=3397211 RepID=UPI003FA2EC39
MRTRKPPAVLGALLLGAVVVSAGRGAADMARRSSKKGGRGSGEARALEGAAALLAASVLADSAVEHYRGSFENPGMFAPLVSAATALVAGLEGAATGATGARAFRQSAFRLSIGVGAAGLAFHVYNIFKRPGGLGWLNLFYGAPIGAPAALTLAGLIGEAGESVAGQPARAPRLLGLPAGRALAGLTSAALAGTVAEVALFHFRGAFQNPFMWAPLTLPPVAAGLMAKAAVETPAKSHPLTRVWLWATALLGVVGAGFHAYGVSRGMGGWRNWSQNVIDGPPLPAPPSFSALSLAALPALSLIEKEADETGGEGARALCGL